MKLSMIVILLSMLAGCIHITTSGDVTVMQTVNGSLTVPISPTAP
jgi:hypothetical protein